ncbi:MAG: PrgI family protein [Roseburia sp.]|nr:PrgI family protein [Roseburia sp.]
MVIEINKDIQKYKESVVMGLTAKQLIFSVASVVVGGVIVLLLYKQVGLTVSAYIAIPVVAPIALSGFYSYNGMSFMEMMRLKLHFLMCNQALTYKSTEGEFVIERIRKEELIAEKKKKKQMFR